jgi:hypothetical protein
MAHDAGIAHSASIPMALSGEDRQASGTGRAAIYMSVGRANALHPSG